MEFKGTIEIETARVILRKVKTGDEVQMFKNYSSDIKVCEYLSWNPHRSVNDAKMFVNYVLDKYELGLTYVWVIILKETNELIGIIEANNIKIEKQQISLSYALGYNYWGLGIMPEAGQAILNHLFNEGFKRVQAWHNVKNTKSGRVMQKLGMTYEGCLKKFDLDRNGNLVDCDMYAIVKE